MKKFIMMLLAVALVFSMVSPVSAITEKQVLDKLEKTYVINGAEFKISPALKKIIEDYAKEQMLKESKIFLLLQRQDYQI